MRVTDSKTAVCAINFFGRVFSSLPYPVQRIKCAGGRVLYVCVVRDNLPEFGVKRSVPGIARVFFVKKARSRTTGFEMLRATLNLARGNIEDRAATPLRLMSLPAG